MADRIEALLNFMRFAPMKLVIFARRVYEGMNGNPAFPKPVVAMDTLWAQIQTCTQWIAEAADGSRKAYAERDKQLFELKINLRFLARYVEITSQGKMEIFQSSGFDPKSKDRTKTAPLSETIRKIKPGLVSGQLRFLFAAIPNADSYELQCAPRLADGTPGEIRTEPFAKTKSYITITNLTPGTLYLFRVRALIHRDFTDWSDWVSYMCE